MSEVFERESNSAMIRNKNIKFALSDYREELQENTLWVNHGEVSEQINKDDNYCKLQK